MNFCCPVCGGTLQYVSKSLQCENNHNFDIAKSGYVNLLLSQKSSAKHHGDDRLMVRSRCDFLEKGYYSHLLGAVCEAVEKNVRDGCAILDAGCGECYYSANIYERLLSNKINCTFLGADISKDALALGAKRNRNLKLAVASVSCLPVADNSCDMVLSIFAPLAEREFFRILKAGGKLIRVIPLEKHLWSLKKAVYDSPYENGSESTDIEGFKLNDFQKVCKSIHLSCNEDIINLFRMTPYYYKTGADDQQKLQNFDSLDTETEFGILTYEKL